MDWGISSETGRLTDILLCRPEHYQWIPTNAIARATLASGAALDRAGLAAQYAGLEQALDEAGVRRHYLAAEPHLPYQVYTRDSSQMTPWGVIITQLYRPQRRGEYAAVLAFYQQAGIPVWRYATAGTLEGGDIHLIRPGLALVGHSGERTDEAGSAQFAGWLEAEGWEVRRQPFAEHFLHQDVTFCMAAEGLAVACTEVLDDDLLAWLRHHRIDLVPVSYKETMQMGCNLLSLGDGRVISPAHSQGLNQRLRAAGLTVFDPPFDLFTRGGGGIHCVTMPLARQG